MLTHPSPQTTLERPRREAALFNKQGVPVWINLTRRVGDRLATFQLLTDPKLTLKK
jgi:hypothetical protein